MTIYMRSYAGAADLQRILELKRACATPENLYDAPTLSDLRTLLAPLPQLDAAEEGRGAGKSDWTPSPTGADPAGDHALGAG